MLEVGMMEDLTRGIEHQLGGEHRATASGDPIVVYFERRGHPLEIRLHQPTSDTPQEAACHITAFEGSCHLGGGTIELDNILSGEVDALFSLVDSVIDRLLPVDWGRGMRRG
jgi:hypothetical protein